jgi:sugar-specific transcriptional regulator TrmB
MKYGEVFEKLGLSKNEGKIYEVLLTFGEQSVGTISEKSGVHRRNIYDSLNRLMEKGLATEIIESGENRYQASEPKKLSEDLAGKFEMLDNVMPELNKLYFSTPTEYRVHTYKGAEGWKQYMRDVLKTGEDFYSIGAEGAWLDERVKSFFPGFLEQIRKKKIKMHHLFDYDVRENDHPIIRMVGEDYRFIPKKYSTNSGIDVFGDRVNIMHNQYLGQVGNPEEIMFTVIVNKNLADSYRTWFKFMWDSCDKN